MADLPSISFCLIARDEERVLGRCLAAVAGLVAETILVDTGSRDRTREIARSAGARVIEVPWTEDFSAPRNVAIERARGAWILMLDADEVLTPASHAGILRAIAHDDFECGLLRLHDADSLEAPPDAVIAGSRRLGEQVQVPRLLRNLPDLRYHGVVHECVTDWLAEHGGRVRLVDADLIHLGRVPEIVRTKGKTRRNVDLLRRRCQQEPTDFTAHGYLAHELLALGEVDEAWAVAEAGLAVLTRTPRRSGRTVHRLIVSYVQLALLRRDLDGVMAAAALGEALEGPHPDLDHLRGCAHEEEARHTAGEARVDHLTQARAFYEAAVVHEGRRLTLGFVAGAGREPTALRLGTVSLQLGAWEHAREAFEKVRSERFALEASLGIVESHVEAWIREGRPEDLRAAEERLGALPATLDGLVLRARLEEARGDHGALRAALFAARSVEAKYLAAHRRLLHLDLVHAAAIYAGSPLPGSSPLGVLSALMAGTTPSLDAGGDLKEDMVVRLIRHLGREGRRDHLAALCGGAAEAIVPGLSSLVERTAGPLQRQPAWIAPFPCSRPA